MNSPFEVICEIEPPTRPDLRHVRHQIGVLSPVADAFLIPDNHLGRATVSSIAVAHEVEAMGGRSIACLNSRDRNLLGFRRDLLTAAAYGVDQFLLVYGDKPGSGGRTSELTVRSMIEEVHGATEHGAREHGATEHGATEHGATEHGATEHGATEHGAAGDHGRAGDPAVPGAPRWRAGVAAALRPLPAWKRAADFVFVQVSYSVPDQLRWRDANQVDVPVYAGVMVLASQQMAARLAAAIPDIEIPASLVEQVGADPMAGVRAACEQVAALRDSGAFDGVHLVPVQRYRQVAALLETQQGR